MFCHNPKCPLTLMRIEDLQFYHNRKINILEYLTKLSIVSFATQITCIKTKNVCSNAYL